MPVKFSNNATTTLSANISSGVTSFTVVSSSSFPTLAVGDWTWVSIDTEVVKVTAISGTTFTCGATTSSHSSGDSAEIRMTAELLNDFAEDDIYNESSTAPTSAIDGDMWLDTDDEILYQRQSGAWVQISDDGTAQGDGNLTTKGDLEVFGTTQTRLPVGTNDQILTADSTATNGVKWATQTAVASVFPFYKADGTSDTIAITNSTFPFFKADGSADNIGVS
jgi:trimeric autotransporter adhesin